MDTPCGRSNSRYGKFILISCIFIAILTQGETAPRKIDCRKFVFAPPCRGIAAKRNVPSYADGVRLLASKISWDFAERNLPDA